jgi:large subunit ribosomal protein L10
LPTQQKIDLVGTLTDKIERSSITVTADFTRIPVDEMTELRRRMRAAGVEFTVVKNTLMHLAADQAQRPQVKDIVQGPTAVAFGYDDPHVVAATISDYIRTTRSNLSFRGAVMGDGPALPPAEVNRLATLPSKPQLVAALMGQLQSPIQRLLNSLNAPLMNFGAVLQARVQQLESAESNG